MTNWIFEANPDHFNLDAFLASGLTTFLFTARQHHEEMNVGDRVFVWRSVGKSKAVAGVVAEAFIAAPAVVLTEDPVTIKFWVSEVDIKPEQRVLLRLNRRANKKQVVQQNWLQQDPTLRDLLILKKANQTNYRLNEKEAQRLGQLWENTGIDWTREELVAGLWAFHQTYGGTVSEKPGSPVAEIALLIGRAVSGVYNRVMNYRALDPTDPRTGMTGGGGGAEAVWGQFFDNKSQALNGSALLSEFNRLWSSPTMPEVGDAEKHMLKGDAEAEKMIKGKTKDELQALWVAKQKLGDGAKLPDRKSAKTYVYERDPLVVALRKEISGRICENPACNHPLFKGVDGQPYIEVHHIVPLGEGGEDDPDNTACLCPACHVEAHRGLNSDHLTASLLALRANLS